MKLKSLLFLTFLSGIIISCSTEEVIEEPIPDAVYSEGIFVLNEGTFNSGNSSVTFINNNLEEVNYRIFKNANSGQDLGDTAQDIGFNGDLAFIVVNVSNKIEVVNRHTFRKVAGIQTGLNNPRKIAFLEGKAYVTNWGDASDPDDDFVAVLNAENFELIKEIPVAEGPEAIVAEGNRIFVAHLGGWSFNNSISVINAGTNEVEKEVAVADLPNSLVVKNGNLWVASSGLPYYAEGGETDGKILKIELNSLEVVEEFNVSGHPENLVESDGSFYYTTGKNVFSFTSSEEILPQTALMELNDVETLYGFTVADSKIYAASADASFTGDGELFIYEPGNNVPLQTFRTGINPNGIFIVN